MRKQVFSSASDGAGDLIANFNDRFQGVTAHEKAQFVYFLQRIKEIMEAKFSGQKLSQKQRMFLLSAFTGLEQTSSSCCTAVMSFDNAEFYTTETFGALGPKLEALITNCHRIYKTPAFFSCCSAEDNSFIYELETLLKKYDTTRADIITQYKDIVKEFPDVAAQMTGFLIGAQDGAESARAYMNTGVTAATGYAASRQTASPLNMLQITPTFTGPSF